MAIKYFTERDLNILHDLFRLRTLTTDQITKVHFDNRDKRDYVYRRMYLLKKEGVIESKALVTDTGRKRTSCYMITDRGISILEEEGVLLDNRIRAKDIRVDGSQLRYVVDINELYVQLHPYGWSMLDSREVKRKYGMNRANLIQGSITNRNGKEYGIYLLKNQPNEETMAKIINEIRNEIIQHVLILCKGKEGYEQLREKIRRERNLHGQMIGLLPFEFALRVLRQFPSEESWRNLFGGYGEVIPVSSKNAFSEYMVMHNGEEKYVANYLLGDQGMIYFLRLYGFDKYQLEKRKVLLFAWNGQVPELQFSQYPHIEIITPQLE